MINRVRNVLWSNFEISPFIENEVSKSGVDIEELEKLDEKQLIKFISKFENQNNSIFEKKVKPSFNKIFERPLFAIAVIRNEKGTKVGQTAKYIGENGSNIFDVPYDYATWYYDRWNVAALVKYNGLYYEYTFRELRQKKNGEVFLSNIDGGKKMLTPTYMGVYTQTLLLNKSRKQI